MNLKRTLWEVRFAFGQIGLALKHGADVAFSILSFDGNVEKRCNAERDTYVARMNAQRP